MAQATDRTKGVTILFRGQIMVTQSPVAEDHSFLNTASFWIQEYKKGNPNG